MKVLDVLIFLVGLVVGSFLNVCIVRIPEGKNIFWGRSKCPHCGHVIPWYDNIPLLSFILLRGRCRYCKQKISVLYPVVELITAIVTLALFKKYGVSYSFLYYVVFAYFLIVLGIIDFKTKLLLNRILLPMLIAGLMINVIGQIVPFKDALIGAVLGGAAMWLIAVLGTKIFNKEALGMGDVKLAFVAGFFLGWKHILIALYLGFIFAFVTIIVLWLIYRKDIPKLIPMGPFLAIGFLIYLFYGQELIQWYLRLIS